MDEKRSDDERLDRSQIEERATRDREANPGDHSHDRGPHEALNNPVGEPDETEWPDPYEKREDPRDSAPAPRPPSTSEPHPPRDESELKPGQGDFEGG